MLAKMLVSKLSYIYSSYWQSASVLRRFRGGVKPLNLIQKSFSYFLVHSSSGRTFVSQAKDIGSIPVWTITEFGEVSF